MHSRLASTKSFHSQSPEVRSQCKQLFGTTRKTNREPASESLDELANSLACLYANNRLSSLLPPKSPFPTLPVGCLISRVTLPASLPILPWSARLHSHRPPLLIDVYPSKPTGRKAVFTRVTPSHCSILSFVCPSLRRRLDTHHPLFFEDTVCFSAGFFQASRNIRDEDMLVFKARLSWIYSEGLSVLWIQSCWIF